MPKLLTTCVLTGSALAGWLVLASSPVLGQRYSSGVSQPSSASGADASFPSNQAPTTAEFAPPDLSTSQPAPVKDARENASSLPAKLEPESQVIEAGKILARINGELILAGEILPQIEAFIQQNRNQIPESQLADVKQKAMHQALNQLIETKLLYSEFRRTVPEENRPEVEKRLAEQFERKMLPKMMEGAKVASRAEFDAKLRESGSSLEAQTRSYSERELSKQWLMRSINRDPVISRTELLTYYEEHQEEYEFEARARWEEVMVRFDRFATRDDAYRRLCEIGNGVLEGRTTFADAAKQHSHGFTSTSGGQHGWTTQGALVSKEIDKALFAPTLPVGQLSPILEGESGFHIIRVIERKNAGRTPFVEAQVEIREKLRRQKVNEEVKAYLAELRKDARIWTIFDEQSVADSERSAGAQLRR